MAAPAHGTADLVVLATNPDVGVALRRMFDVADPWTQAGLTPPTGKQVCAAAAVADPLMPVRIANRLQRPRVAVVLGEPIRQCQRHFDENVARGLEWRPFELALAHETSVAAQTTALLESQRVVDGFFPTFAYMTLANHQRWMPRWHATFGDQLVTVIDDQDPSLVQEIADHFGCPPQGVTEVASDRACSPEGAAWDYVRELLDA